MQVRQSRSCSYDQEREKESYICTRHNQQRKEECKIPETSKKTKVGSRTASIRHKDHKVNMKLPNDLLDLLLTYHIPVCCQEFVGNPRWCLYWAYDKEALKAILGMTKDEFKVVKSSLGQFMRRVPKNSHWWSRLKGIDGPAWAFTPGAP